LATISALTASRASPSQAAMAWSVAASSWSASALFVVGTSASADYEFQYMETEKAYIAAINERVVI
jgi:hypothetical protein